jgi:hypothetical protein
VAYKRVGMGDPSLCPAGQIYNTFYQSCVNNCPSGQAYNAQGICQGPDQTNTYLTLGGVALLAYLLFVKD